MLSKNQLLKAIEETENAPDSYQNCEKLAVFYVLFDKLYGLPEQEERVTGLIETKGNSVFRQSVNGKYIDDVLDVFDELLEALTIYNPSLHDATLQKIADL